MAKVVAILSTFCLLLLLVASVAYVRFFAPGGDLFHRTLDPPALVREVRQLNKLVTVKYSIQKVVGLTEARQPLGSESILLLVDARVTAGIDLSQITQYDVAMPSREEARIRLPATRVGDVFIEERNTKVWDRRITWWTPWVSPDPDLEHKTRMTALEQVRAAAIEMGILKDAERNAQEDIRAVLKAFGIVKVIFVPMQS